MEALYTILFLILTTALISLLLILTLITLRTFACKSMQNPNFPPVKGTVFNLALRYRDLQDFFTAAAAEHPTFRILLPAAESYVYTAEPSNVEHVLKAAFGKYSKGDKTREIMAELFGGGIFVADGEWWRHQRKLAALEFSTRNLRDFSCEVFRKNAVALVRVVKGLSGSGRVFDLQGLLLRWTLDSIFEVGFGVKLNALEDSSEEATKFVKAFDDLHTLVFWRFLDPLWKLKRFLRIGFEVSLRKQVKVVDDFVHQIITKKRALLVLKAEHCKQDILSRFLMESEKDPEKITDKYLRDIILNFMIAGKDSSAGTLSWFFYLLCKHPFVQEKVLQEVRDVVVAGDFDNDENIDNFVAKITEEALENMHYLHAALTETLRLYPAVPVDGRCADVEDTLPNGYKIKKGDEVFYVAYAMGRMTYLWGEDAAEFRPDRWLNNGVFQPESHFKFVSFHAGPRICLGKDFAYRQMKIVAIALLRFFRFKLADETKSLTYKTLLTLQIDGKLSLYALPRTT